MVVICEDLSKEKDALLLSHEAAGESRMVEILGCV